MKPKLLMITAVWGEWHIKMLLNMNLATMLAPNNLSALSEAALVRYRIYTTEEDALKIDRAEIVSLLRNYVEVEIRVLKNVNFSDPIGTHHKVWAWGVKEAQAQNMMIMFLPPDVAWSNQSFKTIGDRLTQGYKVIMMTYLRAEEKAFQKGIPDFPEKGHHIINLSGRELMKLCIEALHPLMAAYLKDSTHFPKHPEMMFWPVKNEGLLLRVFAREMFLFDPNRYQLNKQALPEKKLNSEEACFIDDSDQLFGVSLAPINADLGWYINPQPADAINIAHWWLIYDSPANDFLVSHKIRWHFSPITEEKWQAVEKASDRFIRKTSVLREALRIFSAARNLDCKLAAKLITYSIYTGSALFAAKQINNGMVLFLPCDKALSGKANRYMNNFLSSKHNSKKLLNSIRAHMSKDTHLFQITNSEKGDASLIHKKSQIEMVSGQKLQITKNNGKITIGEAQIISEPTRVGHHLVFVVDNLLISEQSFD
ncbi:MAG: fasciclin domain-containing protein [Paracoccaceae bacterium]